MSYKVRHTPAHVIIHSSAPTKRLIKIFVHKLYFTIMYNLLIMNKNIQLYCRYLNNFLTLISFEKITDTQIYLYTNVIH